MKARFGIGQEVMHGETLATVIVSQKDFSNQKIRYQLSTGGELVYEEELSDVIVRTPIKRNTPAPAEEKPVSGTSLLDKEAMLNEYRAAVGKNVPPPKRNDAEWVLGKTLAEMNEEDILSFVEKYELAVDVDEVESVEDLTRAILSEIA